MTRFTANLILVVMMAVWALLSLAEGELLPVSDNFLLVGLLIAAGELSAGVDLKTLIRRRLGLEVSGDSPAPPVELPGSRPAATRIPTGRTERIR